jgi:dTDP-4-amino-4,6-dideoxygalactose transaminase
LPRVAAMFVPAFPPIASHRARRRTRRRPWRTRDVFPGARLFARGRFALYEGLRVLAEIRGVRRLWVPAYVCRPVADAAAAAGLAVALYDVDERLQPRWATIEPARRDAMLALHYFGLALPRRPLQEFCSAHDMPLLEDCAHAVPDPGAAVQVGSYGALAIFSLRKQAPVPGGGLLVVNDPELRRAVRVPAGYGVGDRRTLVKLGIMLGEWAAFTVGWNVLPFKDRLPVLDAHPGPGAGEPAGPVAPDEYARPPSPAVLLPPMLARLDWREQIRTRRVSYRRLAARLRGTPGVALAVPVPPPGSVPQAMPILVERPDHAARALRARGVEAMVWPGREQIPFRREACPGTVAWLDRGLLLPLGCALTSRYLDRVADAVRQAADLTERAERAAVSGPPNGRSPRA